MSKRIYVRAVIRHYDDAGRTTRKPQHVKFMLCTGEDPQRFDMQLPDKRVRRFSSVTFTRAEVERVLRSNPKRKKRV